MGNLRGKKPNSQMPFLIPMYLWHYLFIFLGGDFCGIGGGGGGRPFRFPWKGMILGKNPRRVTSPGWMCSSKMRLEAFEV